jgi:4-aminobutyrate aminotransferase-like enzyme
LGLILVGSNQKTNVNSLFFYRYPLEENVRENEAEDQRCLAQVEEILEAKSKGPVPCVGVIVEPIQSEGGDHHGSPAWFQGLQVNFYQTLVFCSYQKKLPKHVSKSVGRFESLYLLIYSGAII